MLNAYVLLHCISISAMFVMTTSIAAIVFTFPVYFLIGEAIWYSSCYGMTFGPLLTTATSVVLVLGLLFNGNIHYSSPYEKYL